MKKILLSAVLLSSVAFGADAVTYAYDVPANYTGTYALSSPASYGGKKFYVNPGHGGFDSDDRPTVMPLLGSEKYYESESNLDRGKHLQQFLIQNGASVKMSRTTNTTADDLNLTSIATYSNSYGGYFMSLHSNGANASANYVVAFYRGNSANHNEVISGSKAMCTAVVNWHDTGRLTDVTYSTPRALSDYQFMGWNYGVLRTNNRAGYLVETWFHDYRPESLRMKSSVYNKFLAWQIARGTLVSPGGTGSLPACIIGDIRDKSASCGYTGYTVRNRDAYLAVHGAKVTLLNSSGTQVATHTTDSKGNGVYGFFVPAGTYTIRVEKSGYKTQEHSVTVTNNNITKKLIDFVQGTNDGISLNPSTAGFGETPVGNTSGKTITVTGTGLTANIAISNSDNTNFSISTTSLGATGGSLTITYKPQSAGTHTTTIKFTSGSKSTSMVVTGTAKNPPLSFTEGWNYSENSGKKAAWMTDYASYRNMAFGNGKLYVVDVTSGVIKVIKAQTAEHLYDLDMTGVEGGAIKLVDVAFVDGKLVGTNIASTVSPTLKVYVWDTDTSAPRKILETTNLGGMARVGDCIEIKGNLTNGKIVYLGQETRTVDGADKTCNSLLTYDIVNGVVSTTPVEAEIDAFIVGLSPRAKVHGDNYWVMGQNYRPSTVSATGELTYTVNSAALETVWGNDWTQFDFKGSSYAFATDYDGDVYASDNTKSLLSGSAVLIDAAGGWTEAERVGAYPSNGLGSTTRNTSMSSSICVNVNGTSGVEMWVLVHNQGIAYYKHGTAPTYSYEDPTKPAVSVSAASVELTQVVGLKATKTITVTGARLTGDINIALSGDSQFSIDKTSISKADGKGDVTISYLSTTTGTHNATLTITSDGATTAKVTLKGTSTPNLNDNITSMKEVWNYSANTTAGTWMSAATSPVTRFIAYNDGKLYVLNSSAWNTTPAIHIVDAYTGADTGADVNLEGVVTSGVWASLSSIRFVDGTLVASSASNANHTFRVYAWKNGVSSAPTIIVEDATHEGLVMGANISISGNLTNGRIWANDAGCNNVLYYTITNGTVSQTPTKIALTDADGAALSLVGAMGASEVIPNADGTFWVDGQSAYPILFNASGKQIGTMQAGVFNNNTRGTALKMFTFGTKKYAAAVAYSGTSQASGYFTLTDITAGEQAATGFICKYPEAGLGSTANDQNISSICQSTRENGTILDIWVCCAKQGVAHYTYDGRIYTGVEAENLAQANGLAIVVNGSTLQVTGVDAEMIQLYSISGACVGSIENSNELDVTGLNGIYIAAVKGVDGSTLTKKVIIK